MLDKRKAMVALVALFVGSVPVVGCAVGGALESGEDTGDDASELSNDQWVACSYGETIDSFAGLSVKCDEPNGHGTYQCVELANRYLTDVDHEAALHGNATDLCSIASGRSGLEVFSPGGSWGHHAAGHKPVAGDLLVWSGGSSGFGHVAVVASTTSSRINYVQQNWGWYENGHWGQASRSSTSWNGSFFGQPGASSANDHPPKCWIHATASSGPGGGGGGSDCVEGGYYCGGDKLHGDADTLYRCRADGTGAVVRTCAYGCQVNAGQDDACKARASDCVTGGYYCGGDKLHGALDTLYRCQADGTGAVVKHCSNGCKVRSGEDDVCR
ncbi:MAG TPA: CHAP domain-containing protein [Minicystis sp.]|nr:CHAP domain-containing protein [Minicystis sp.]